LFRDAFIKLQISGQGLKVAVPSQGTIVKSLLQIKFP